MHLPMQGQMLGSTNTKDEPPMPGHAEVLLEAMQVRQGQQQQQQ